MTRAWNDIQWIFEPDGSLRDIYIQDTSLQEWNKLIDHLNANFSLSYSDRDKIDKEYALDYLQDTSREMESRTLTIHLRQIKINCFFFLLEQIEFDITPEEVNSLSDFEQVEKFMVSISEILQKQVTLTGESSPEFPLFKVDVKNGINQVLTEEEARGLSKTKSSRPSRWTRLKARMLMKFFPKRFEKKLLNSANDEYKATKEEENIW